MGGVNDSRSGQQAVVVAVAMVVVVVVYMRGQCCYSSHTGGSCHGVVEATWPWQRGNDFTICTSYYFTFRYLFYYCWLDYLFNDCTSPSTFIHTKR